MAISIAALEAAAAGGWRGTEEEAFGGWLLRAAGGFTGRANSALAIGDPGLPLAAAVDKVCAWYQARGLPPAIAISYPPSRQRSRAWPPPRPSPWTAGRMTAGWAFTAIAASRRRRRRSPAGC